MNRTTPQKLQPLAVVLMALFIQGCIDPIEFCGDWLFAVAPAPVAAVESNTDMLGIGVEGSCPQIPGRVCISPAIEVGKGTESYSYDGDEFFKQEIRSIPGDGIDYTVFQTRAHMRYPFAVTADSSVTVSPIAGPRFYRWSADDCTFGECTENLFVVDIGAGIQYKNFGLDLYTGLNGPNFSARLKYSFVR